MADERIAITADLLAQGYEPSEITDLIVVDRAMRKLISFAVDFELSGSNIKQGDPRWHTAMSIRTGFIEALRPALEEVIGSSK